MNMSVQIRPNISQLIEDDTMHNINSSFGILKVTERICRIIANQKPQFSVGLPWKQRRQWDIFTMNINSGLSH